MLRVLGIKTVEELFSAIPREILLSRPLTDDGMSESEALHWMETLARKNRFPDYEADKKAGKRNLIVKWGPGISRVLYCIFMLTAFLSIILLVSHMEVSYLIIISFITFPLAIKAMRILWREYLSHEGIIPAQALTIQLMVFQGLLISLGLVLSRFINA